jgi:hypothetical protein
MKLVGHGGSINVNDTTMGQRVNAEIKYRHANCINRQAQQMEDRLHPRKIGTVRALRYRDRNPARNLFGLSINFRARRRRRLISTLRLNFSELVIKRRLVLAIFAPLLRKQL